MPITNEKLWQKQVENNKDAYGKCCVDVAREVMRLLDESTDTINTHDLICKANKNIGAGSITGFMAGAVASMVSQVSQCHSRGEEFRRAWNTDTQLQDEGDKANESGGTLNPALLNVEVKK